MSRITILKINNQIGIDGKFLTVDCSDLPEDFHALQWDGTEGEIEWKGKPRPPNTEITDLKEYQKYIDMWHSEKDRLDEEMKKAQAEYEAMLAAQAASSNTTSQLS